MRGAFKYKTVCVPIVLSQLLLIIILSISYITMIKT